MQITGVQETWDVQELFRTGADKTAEEKKKENDSGVSLEISEQMKEMYQQQAESAKKAGEGMRDLAKLLEIARRISRGDKVPASDEKKLMEYSSDLYQAAKSAAMLNANKKRKKHKSMFGDEEEQEKNQKIRNLRRESDHAETAAAGESEAAQSSETDTGAEGE